MRGKRENRNPESRKNKIKYAAGAGAIAGLLAVAFFVPQLVFEVRDGVDTSGYRFESMQVQDVTLLGTAYETSLYNRLARFAREESQEVRLYVAGQDMEPDQELYTFLLSDEGLYQESVTFWTDTSVIPYFFRSHFEVTAWKQYVIYSDDYANGVDFILWYLELSAPNGAVLKLLMDADDGAVYGLRVSYGELENPSGTEETTWLWDYNELFGGSSLGDIQDRKEFGMLLFYYMGGLKELEDVSSYAAAVYGLESKTIFYDTTGGTEIRTDSNRLSDETQKQWEALRDQIGFVICDGEKQIDVTFPYGEFSENFRMQIESEGYYFKEYGCFYPEVMIGFPAVCELIPEFIQ